MDNIFEGMKYWSHILLLFDFEFYFKIQKHLFLIYTNQCHNVNNIIFYHFLISDFILKLVKNMKKKCYFENILSICCASARE